MDPNTNRLIPSSSLAPAPSSSGLTGGAPGGLHGTEAGELQIGRYELTPLDLLPQLVCDDGRLRPFLDRPEFRAVVRSRQGLRFPSPEAGGEGPAVLPDAARERHGMIWGASGNGKTFLAVPLLARELSLGRSVVYVDPKGEGFDLLLAEAARLGFPADDVVLLDPRSSHVPGWNPLDAGTSLALSARDFVALLERAYSSWGPRLADLLLSALLVAGARGLSLWEVSRLLVRDEYRDALLRQAPVNGDLVACGEAEAFFRDEFPRWGRAERTAAVGPVLNKLRPILHSEFLTALLCARRNTLDLAGLWQRPRLMLARLDAAVLGEDAARLLAGLLAQSLLRTALRARRGVPVVLAVDELPVLERFVGGTVAEILAIARSQGLRLLVLGQNLAQVSDGLREALFGNTGFQCFFRLGSLADARLAATLLAGGTPVRLRRAVVSVDAEDPDTGEPEEVRFSHPVRDPWGRPLRLRADVWRALSKDGGPDLKVLARWAAAGGVSRLYVEAPDGSGPVALHRYVQDLPEDAWQLRGPELSLIVWVPRPRLAGVERWDEAETARAWVRLLLNMPVQRAALRIPGAVPFRASGVVQVQDAGLPAGTGPNRAYVAACRRANAQPPHEARAARAWREAELRRVEAGNTPAEISSTLDTGGNDDGSIF